MTNQQTLATLSADACYSMIMWMLDYGKKFADSRLAIIEWLQSDSLDSKKDTMTKRELIKALIDSDLPMDKEIRVSADAIHFDEKGREIKGYQFDIKGIHKWGIDIDYWLGEDVNVIVKKKESEE